LSSVTDDEIAAAVKWLFATAKIVAEPSGAATTAAVLARAASDDVTVAVVSGGNVAPDDFARYIAG
jgi:threonine dehydratase